MRAVSAKRRSENAQRRLVMNFVRDRDGHQCVGAKTNRVTGETYLPERCHGPLNGHEIITRADGGSITDAGNIVLLCDFHNGWCDLNHDEAVIRGFRQVRRIPFSPTVAARLPHLDLVLNPVEESQLQVAAAFLNTFVPANNKRPAPLARNDAGLPSEGDSTDGND